MCICFACDPENRRRPFVTLLLGCVGTRNSELTFQRKKYSKRRWVYQSAKYRRTWSLLKTRTKKQEEEIISKKHNKINNVSNEWVYGEAA